MKSLRGFAHQLFALAGLEVRNAKAAREARAQERRLMERGKWALLRRFEPRLIIDVGANEGQFAAAMRVEFPRAKIISFEPLPAVFETLRAKFAADPLLLPVQLALGDRNGVATMHQSAFSPSSSLLPMAALHVQEFPKSEASTAVEVPEATLDHWFAGSCLAADAMLVKIDVQGFELAVLAGGSATVSQARAVLLEVSFEELYVGQPLFGEIHARLEALGFRFAGVLEQFASKAGDRALFADAIYVNRKLEQDLG
jgi:FkbM family methyltransferase